MADSYAHKWGQKIGDLLEDGISTVLGEFATKHNLYLDKKGVRPARLGLKATWKDINGNKHDLDYVLEKNGSAAQIGTPVAFIEGAWRRYTKHSRNKVQEIQGAILPLVSAYRRSAPFMGAILAGVFTDGAVQQLESVGFSILYLDYAGMVQAFQEVGVDAAFDEKTSGAEFKKKLKNWNALQKANQTKVGARLFDIYKERVTTFLKLLEQAVLGEIDTVFVTPLHCKLNTLQSVTDAISFIQTHNESAIDLVLIEYVIGIRYNNGSTIEARLKSKEDAVSFLRDYLPPPITPVTARL